MLPVCNSPTMQRKLIYNITNTWEAKWRQGKVLKNKILNCLRNSRCSDRDFVAQWPRKIDFSKSVKSNSTVCARVTSGLNILLATCGNFWTITRVQKWIYPHRQPLRSCSRAKFASTHIALQKWTTCFKMALENFFPICYSQTMQLKLIYNITNTWEAICRQGKV